MLSIFKERHRNQKRILILQVDVSILWFVVVVVVFSLWNNSLVGFYTEFKNMCPASNIHIENRIQMCIKPKGQWKTEKKREKYKEK